MAWTKVQGSGSDQLSGTSASQAFTSIVTSGSVVAGYIFYTDTNTTNQISSITDDKLNTYSVIGFTTANPTQVYNCAVFWSGGALTNGPKTLTFNLNVSSSNIWVEFGEFTPPTGTLGTDGYTGQYVASGSPTSGSITTTVNGDLIICGTACNGTVSGVGTGFTVVNTSNATSGANTTFPARVAGEFQSQTSAGAINGTWSGTPAGDSICAIGAIKAVTAANGPFPQYNWPVSPPPDLGRTWTQHLQPPQPVGGPFNQYNWPNPYPPSPIDWFWAQDLTRELPVPPNPFAQHDWPAALVPPQIDRTWTVHLQPPQPVGGPFPQDNWPNPPLPFPIDWFWGQNLTRFVPAPAPFVQYDWPLTVIPPQIDRSWTSNRVIYTTFPAPFANYNWPISPLPYQIDPTWLQDLVNILSLTNPLPHSQYDWPLPPLPYQIDPTWLQEIINLFPPPPPPPAPTSSGYTWTKEEWTKKLTQYVQQHQKLLTFSEMGKLGGRPRKS